MQDDSQQTPAPMPHLEGERRKQDRRQSDRQGKYDRRKNRCIHCAHFQEEEGAGKGLCTLHQLSMPAYAFACPNFMPISQNPGD